ncbi:hypothetical protein EI94DRAFT_1724374 [Lactarius quietus]|nr:hypothetical protein EI94DRAFT_1724374 [Lactarius quietus]
MQAISDRFLTRCHTLKLLPVRLSMFSMSINFRHALATLDPVLPRRGMSTMTATISRPPGWICVQRT